MTAPPHHHRFRRLVPARRALLAGLLGIAASSPLGAMETVTFSFKAFREAEPEVLTVTGRSLARDSVGSRFFETDDGARYLMQARDLRDASEDDRPFDPVDHETLGERLLSELPTAYRIHDTKRYVIAYDTSREYAEWTSSLLERLYKALTAYWRRQGLDVTEPEFPLPIVIHRDQAVYRALAEAEGVPPSAVGYYSTRTNRVRMFDLTGSDAVRAAARGVRRSGTRRGSRREITQMLSTRIAEPLVATIVHEATHQVCFNTGVMQRLATLPLWYVEGMAVYFEAPDASGSRGWRGIGKVNRRRLATFRGNLPEWNRSSLPSLIATDDRLRDPRTGGDAYADAWALTYFLIQKRNDAYVAYAQELSERSPLDGPPADESDSDRARRRVSLFRKHFGDPRELERAFLEEMGGLSAR